MRISKLDGLRGLASLMVVVHHFGKNMLPAGIYSNFIIRNAYILVDLFFVLSGFVIALNYAERIHDRRGLLTFMRKRFVRLYPLLSYTTLVYLCAEVGAALLMPGAVKTPVGAAELAGMTIDTLLMTNATPLFGSTDGLNFPAWSISAEMISYAVFGLIMLAFRGHARILVIGLVMAIAATILILHGRYFSGGAFGFARALLCFHAGALISLRPLKPRRMAAWMEWIVPAGILMTLWLLHGAPEGVRMIIGIGLLPAFFVMCIILLNRTSGILGKWLDSKVMRYAGKISYSVYLNHAILILLAPRITFGLSGIPFTTWTGLMVSALTLLLVLVYSNLTYEWVEIRGGKWLERKLKGREKAIPTGINTTLVPFPEVKPARELI
jgi:peptidoglycan/LPS O-acetylase OafA/YrhL